MDELFQISRSNFYSQYPEELIIRFFQFPDKLQNIETNKKTINTPEKTQLKSPIKIN